MSRKASLTLGIVFVFFLGCVLHAQTSEQDQQKAMEEYMKMGAPNENHDYLKFFVGQWNVTTTAWMQPGAPPVTSQNSAEAELVLGGRFLKMSVKGNMFGQPFEGLQIWGYDNLKKKYTILWIDNTSTSFYLSEATRDPSGKVWTETGLWPDQIAGGTVGVRMVTKIVSPDEYVGETYMTGADGKEFKTMENRLVRKK
jgi:hypothetical protein